MEVECIGNTQIIHMEETGITQRTIGLMLYVFKVEKVQNVSFLFTGMIKSKYAMVSIRSSVYSWELNV